MPSSTVSIALLLVLVGVASALNASHVGHLLGAGLTNVAPARLTLDDSGCQDAVSSLMAKPCLAAFKNSMQGINTSSPTKDDVDKMLNALSPALNDYCSDKCAADDKSSLASVRDQCHIASSDKSSKKGVAVSAVAWARDYACSRSSSNDFCMVSVMNTLKPVFEQYPSYGASILVKLTDPDNAPTASDSDVAGASTALGNMSKSQFCTPCMQFYFQQAILMMPKVAILTDTPTYLASNQADQIASGLNSKCGSDWLSSTDSSRFQLDQDSAPTIKGNAVRAASSPAALTAMAAAAALLVNL
ncbi:hypothetical protein RI367_006767 [Sorochytrium milnesiophthora]